MIKEINVIAQTAAKPYSFSIEIFGTIIASEKAMNGGGAEDAAELNKTLKHGERVLAPTRRPDGTLRKPIRIRAGYVPQDEVAIYQSKGAIWRKEMSSTQEVPPGYDQAAEPKPKSKSAKRNERKKEKRQQAALHKDTNSEQDNVLSTDNSNNLPENVESSSIKLNELSLSESALTTTPPTNSTECSTSEDQVQDIEKKVRALKKKIRLTEAQQQKTSETDMKPEQLEKLAKLESWRSELKLLEDKKSELRASMS